VHDISLFDPAAADRGSKRKKSRLKIYVDPVRNKHKVFYQNSGVAPENIKEHSSLSSALVKFSG
jgi:hypothetical protein